MDKYLAANKDEDTQDDEDRPARLDQPPPAYCHRARPGDLLPSASARCLPRKESFQRLLTEVERFLDPQYFTALRDPRALDWIESHLPSGAYHDRGGIAALCGFSWERALSWLKQGRPLSHLALDAFKTLIYPFGDPNEEGYGVRLLDPPRRRTLSRVLKVHARREAVPRVQK